MGEVVLVHVDKVVGPLVGEVTEVVPQKVVHRSLDKKLNNPISELSYYN